MNKPPSRVGLALAAVALGLAIPLVLAEIALRFSPVYSGLHMMAVNAQHPVARYEPNRRFAYSLGATFDVVSHGRVNNVGWVNDQDYDSTATTPLLAVIGDSYVEAAMVRYPATLQGRLASAVGPRARVYSFGVSGSPLSQYLVMADEARRTYHPTTAVVVVVGNDFDESLRKYQIAPRFWTFADSAGRLRLSRVDYKPSLLRRLGRSSALVRYLVFNVNLPSLVARLRAPRTAGAAEFAGNVQARVDSARLADSRRAVDEFLAELPGRIGLPPGRVALVVDAVRPQIYDPAGLAAADSTYFGRMRQYLMAGAREHGFVVVDMQPRFVADYARNHRRFEFEADGHWNELGHAEAAAAVEASPVFAELLQGK